MRTHRLTAKIGFTFETRLFLPQDRRDPVDIPALYLCIIHIKVMWMLIGLLRFLIRTHLTE